MTAGLPPSPRRSAFGRAVEAANAIGSIWLVALMVLINADVIGRAFLDRPIRGVAEMVSLSIVGIVFLQLAHALRGGRFVRSDLTIDRLTLRRPRIGHGFRAVYDLLGLALLGVIIAYGVPHLIEAWVSNDYMGSINVFTVPVWPIVGLVLIGSAATAIQYAIDLARDAAIALGLASPPSDGPPG